MLGASDFVTPAGAFGPAPASPTASNLGSNNSTLMLMLAYDDGTVSGAKRLFVSDGGNNRVLVYNADPSTMADGDAAIHVLGQTDFVTSGGGGSCTQATMSFPWGVAWDAVNQRVIVADTWNNRVLLFDGRTANLTDGDDAMAVVGQADFVSNAGVTGPATAAGLSAPVGVAYDGATNTLYVADGGNNRVTVYAAAPGTLVNGAAAALAIGQADLVSGGSGCSATQLAYPEGLWFEPSLGAVLVADAQNNRVLVFPTPGQSPGPQSGGAAAGVVGQFDYPGRAAGFALYNNPTAPAFAVPQAVTLGSGQVYNNQTPYPQHLVVTFVCNGTYDAAVNWGYDNGNGALPNGETIRRPRRRA